MISGTQRSKEQHKYVPNIIAWLQVWRASPRKKFFTCNRFWKSKKLTFNSRCARSLSVFPLLISHVIFVQLGQVGQNGKNLTSVLSKGQVPAEWVVAEPYDLELCKTLQMIKLFPVADLHFKRKKARWSRLHQPTWEKLCWKKHGELCEVFRGADSPCYDARRSPPSWYNAHRAPRCQSRWWTWTGLLAWENSVQQRSSITFLQSYDGSRGCTRQRPVRTLMQSILSIWRPHRFSLVISSGVALRDAPVGAHEKPWINMADDSALLQMHQEIANI